MKKFSIMICLVSALLLGMASCGDSQQKRLRLSKQEKARLDSIERNLGPIISANAPVVTMTDRQQARYIESLGFTR